MIKSHDLFLNGLDDQKRSILEQSIGWTMCAPLQRHFMMDVVRYLQLNGIEGDIVECGVWRGGMMQIAARTLIANGLSENDCALRNLWLYDTFEGMPASDSPFDRDMYNGVHANDHLAQSPRVGPAGQPTVWCDADYQDVEDGITATGYPVERVRMVKGMVESTIPQTTPEQIALLRVDTDWESSTRHILEHLYPLVVSRGVVAFDDYESWEGARKAVDEYFALRNEQPLLIRLDKGRVLIKT